VTIFAYRAINDRQMSVQGVISADSPRQARDGLRERGLMVQDLVSQAEAAKKSFLRFRGRVSSSRITTTIRELATLLSVGVPVLEAIDTVAQEHRGAYQSALLLVRDRIAGGASLAEAMSDQPQVFDELTVRMVEVGENAGNLDVVLKQLADYKERVLQLKDRVLGALLYPAMVFLASVAVTLFLMTVVVPMLLTSLLEMGRELPWPTRVLKAMSDLLVHHSLFVGVTMALVVFASLAALKSKRGRRAWQRVIHATPLLGSMVKRQAISRISMVISTLMRSGIEYLDAAEIAARTSRNLLLQDALRESSHEINAGRNIGEALARTGFFPAVVVHVFAVGQASGRLEEMLDSLAENYDREVASLSNKFAAVLEPILIIVLAVFVGFILFATLLPILEAGNVL
jgi:type II secretory pathway component PulF